ncbi:GNAT family N-acetyltransferase [Vibrio sp. HN007]|uniref:GNAT family N-acetyltransferase n=1 Tax=Vibrio iocasae TaxID=3098914 RepID=UPI0035D421E1
MKLVHFSEQYYDILIQWIDSEKLNYLWGGPHFQFPLTLEQISVHCAKPEVYPYVLVVEGKNAGYVELFKVSEDHYRICRVFIAKEFRGKGLSTSMLEALISKAKEQLNCTRLSLAVFTHNAPAIACYKSLGFEVVKTENNRVTFEGESWDLYRMERSI